MTTQQQYPRRTKSSGFTLIELMIVVAIIGIIAAIAYPSYTEYVNKSRRADGMAALQSFAGAMERHFTVNSSYCGAGTTAAGSCAAASGIPTIFPAQAPLDGGDKYYNLSILAASASATSFLLQAIPISGSPQNGDRCKTLTLTHTGVRNTVPAGIADCWP